MKPDTHSSSRPSLSHIKETCLYVRDTSRTRAFYEGVLGLRCITEIPGRLVFFQVGVDMLLCFLRSFSEINPQLPPHGAEGSQHLAFEAPSSEVYEAWKQYLLQKGITIEHEATWNTGKRSFYFRDPDEHSIEITEPGIWAF
ncbi:MAG: VOC family protein [Bacteroidia bacterium]|nr:VOC family protein [Bacteroidia bacterium]